MRLIPRRAFAGALGAGVLWRMLPAWCADRVADSGRLGWEAETAAGTGSERHYRADAQILLFSLPLFRRQGVGGGSVTWRQSSATAAGIRLLEFVGFSRPERAAGLNRLGWIRELTRWPADGAPESIYFGVMTASPEESVDEAKKAMHSSAAEAAYTAIDGRVAPTEVETNTAHFLASPKISLESRQELMKLARNALASAKPGSSRTDSGTGTLPFLQTLAEMLRAPDRRELQYSYNGRAYRLWMKRAADVKATAHFHEQRLIAAGHTVIRFEGKLRRAAGGKEHDFRIWIDSGAQPPVPLRIEYQPKSYLRLVFEAEASAD